MKRVIRYIIQMGLLMVLLVCVLLTSSAIAIGNLHVGKVRLFPELSYNGEYNSNIFSEQ